MQPPPPTLSHALLAWFHKNQRVLPWRHAPAGQRPVYPTWVSEVMLQQTQVNTVIPYFQHWMQRFPSLETVARAPQSDVLKAWEGLGYYRRARLLHKAAQQVVQEYAGNIPDNYHDLQQLAGLGEYTAAAIASLCFNEAVIAADANVKRLASRLFCLETLTANTVSEKLQPHQPTTQAGNFNEALIELGALLCTAKNPQCQACPLQNFCQAYQEDKVAVYPKAKKKRAVPTLERYALIYCHDAKVWLEQRPQDAMLGGLWGFPLCKVKPEGTALPLVKHAYSHFKIRVTPVQIARKELEQRLAQKGKMVALARLEHYALSSLDHKILGLFQTTS